MIRLDTGTPGAGKTLINVKEIIELERLNKRNLLLNQKIYTSNLERIKQNNYQSEFEYLVRKEGQGVDLRDVAIHFDSEYFNLFEQDKRPEDYFLKSIYYNEIIERLNKEHDLTLNKLKAVRTIYTNISGLEVDHVRPIPSDADWTKFPDGSFVVFDEIQNIPVFASETKSMSHIIKLLTTHRHRGFDLVGITQFPNLVRREFLVLVGHHRHLVNSFGLKRSTVYHWSTYKSDPNARINKATSEVKGTFAFPPSLFKYYRSSTAHTHKRRLPWRFIFILVAVLLSCISLFTCTFQNDSNILKKITTGDSSASVKDQDDKHIDNAKSSSEEQSNKENEQKDFDSQDSVSSASVFEPSYDVSDPFSYIPDHRPDPVNHRVFAGCFCTKNTCKAYDQQGTRIREIDSKLCKNLMNDSTDRPFDYFNVRTQNHINTENSSEKLTSNEGGASTPEITS